MNRIYLAASFLAFSALVNSQALAQKEELKISAGPAALNHVFKKIEEPFEKESGIQLTFTKGPKDVSSDQAIMDVEEGRVEGGVSALDFSAWISDTKKRNLKIKDYSEFKQRVIGNDKIRFVTFPDGPKKISDAHLEGILLGTVKNWKEVGGPDVPVKLVLVENAVGSIKFVRERVVGGKELRTDVLKVPDLATLQKTIVSTPGAIGFGNSSVVLPEMNAPEHRTVGRPLTMIWKGEPSPRMRKLLDFIQSKGQQYIRD